MLNEEESLKKENITIESSTKEFNKKNEKMTNLREKIEQEIIKINNLYDNVNKDIIKHYEIKHESLIKEENDLKEKLQNEVTKVKEKLECFLSECNKIIKLNEKINKGIKKINNENILKSLSYISTINKNQKNMNLLFQQLMGNIKISFEQDKSNIKFEEYYFNGIPTPKNIEVKDITANSFKLNWIIDNINIIDFDKNKIKYQIEIRKDNQNFNKIYEGNNTYYLIEQLNKNTNYEVRICSFYNDIYSQWTDIKKIKTNDSSGINFDKTSLIIGNNIEYETLLKNWINPNINNIKAELLYRLSRDESSYQTFHKYCDDKGPTVTIVHDVNNIKTGGYTPLSWDSNTQWKYDNDTFIFNLTNKKKFGKPNNNNSGSIYCYNSYGPWFNNFGFECDHNMEECKFQAGNAFLNANEIIPNENKEKYFKVKEVEVYKIICN